MASEPTTVDSIGQTFPLGKRSPTDKTRMADELDLPFDDEVFLAIRYSNL